MSDPPRSTLVDDVAAWLETLAIDADTLAASLDDTIVPTVLPTTADSLAGSAAAPGSAGRDTDSGDRAVALLHALAGQSPTSTAQLEQREVIAEGGMGVIRAGYQVGLGRTVAVKTLRDDRRGQRNAIDLLREAWVTGIVEHPNVVPVHHVGIGDDGQPLIVLKRIEGVEWSKLIGDAKEVHRRFGTTDLLAWNLGTLLQLLNALRFAHARGIIHRDLKPSNVMIGEFGEVYLLDWGIAVSLRPDDLGRLPLASRATEMAGTPVYMAPEMLRRDGSPPISERTDIYLAGAVLHELISGKPPHQGTTVLAVISSVILSTPELPPDAPPELVRICTRALQADPDDRYASVDELRLALVSYLEHRASTHLFEVANERLARLLDVLARRSSEPAEQDDDEIYRLFGACRFGYHEALAAWSGNEEATRGLRRATEAVARHELAAGAPRAALTLLSELAEPPRELLEQARRAVADQASRLSEADDLRRQHDVVIGSRTRAVAMMILGVMVVVTPLLVAIRPGIFPLAPTHASHALWSGGFLAFVLVFGVWARESLMATALNRRAFVAISGMFGAQILLFAAAWRLGIAVEATEVLLMFVWVMSSGMAALAIDRRLTLGFLTYLIAFAITIQRPEDRFYIMAIANGAFSLNAIVRWWPGFPRRDERRPY